MPFPVRKLRRNTRAAVKFRLIRFPTALALLIWNSRLLPPNLAISPAQNVQLTPLLGVTTNPRTRTTSLHKIGNPKRLPLRGPFSHRSSSDQNPKQGAMCSHTIPPATIRLQKHHFLPWMTTSIGQLSEHLLCGRIAPDTQQSHRLTRPTTAGIKWLP